MNKELKISAENALAAYNNTDANGRELLEHLFGKEIFTQDIKDKVKTFEDAVAILGDEHPLVAQFRVIESSFKEADNNLHLFAYARLVIIAEALNEGWKPKFDGDECRYYPWFYIYTKKEYEELDEDEKKECRVVGRSDHISVRLRMAVSFVRMRMMRHRTPVRISVLGLPSRQESLLSTAESNSSIFGRDSFLLELRRYGRMDKNKQRDCKSLAMAGCRKAEMVA